MPIKRGMGSQHPVIGWPQQVASDSEKILDNSADRPESLCLSHGFESSHLSLTLSDRLMRDFGPIVSGALRVMHDRRHQGVARCLIAPQLDNTVTSERNLALNQPGESLRTTTKSKFQLLRILL